jgi:hypothetical protein
MIEGISPISRYAFLFSIITSGHTVYTRGINGSSEERCLIVLRLSTPVEIHLRFGGMHCLHLLDRKLCQGRNQQQQAANLLYSED